MSTQSQIDAIILAAGAFLHPLPLIVETNESGISSYHCAWQHQNGEVRCYSRGGQSSTRYVWEFIPKIPTPTYNLFTGRTGNSGSNGSNGSSTGGRDNHLG